MWDGNTPAKLLERVEVLVYVGIVLVKREDGIGIRLLKN